MNFDIFNNSIPTIEHFSHVVNSEWFEENHAADCICLVYVISGQAVYTADRQKILISTGEILCIPKGAERFVISSEPEKFECFAVNFNLHNLGEDAELPLPRHSHIGMRNDLLSHYRKLEEDFSAKTHGYVMRSRARLMLIIQRLMEILVYDADTHIIDPRINQAIRFIAENHAKHIVIADVASAVSLNPVYFGTLFKRETGMTFRDYLNTIRINQAEDMLRAGTYNVTEVAAFCGFSDVFYFSRLFKKYKGIPPSSVMS
ncbi:MAG: AraC family transcriptional regulator [Defluviitaleaceae bacterium]|nr:AraC family transcriptional regulator [Defluviitaleaceae bacterium]